MSTVPPIRREIIVDADPAAAFEVFTAALGRWWPMEEHSVHGKGATVAFLTRMRDAGYLVLAGPLGDAGFTQDMLTDLGSSWGRWGVILVRSVLMFRPRPPARPGGWNPAWSARSRSPSGPPTGSCASRAGAGCGSTRTPPRCGGKTDRSG